MENLPSNQTGSAHLSAARADHREWIGGRAVTLLSHYWRDDDPAELTAAIGKDWADVLEGIPQEFIQRACIRYQQDEPRRKPTPGAIYRLAVSYMPRPQLVKQEDPPKERISHERAKEILEEAGAKLNKFGGVEKL